MPATVFPLILLFLQQGVPAIVELVAMLKAEGALTPEQIAAIEAAAPASDAAWDERVAAARARLEAA